MSCGLIRTGVLCKLSLAFCCFIAEVVISRWTGSVAVLSDSLHVLSEVMASGVALLGLSLSANDQTPARNTYGWVRAEVVASLVNAVFLGTLSVTVVLDAARRLADPCGIEDPELLLGAGIAGLLVKLLSLFLCRAHSTENSRRVRKTRKNRIWKPEMGSEDCSEEETNQLMGYSSRTQFGLSVKEILQRDTPQVWMSRGCPHEDQQSGCCLGSRFLYVLAAMLSSAVVVIEALVFTFLEQLCPIGENGVNWCTSNHCGELQDTDSFPLGRPADVRKATTGPCWIPYLDPTLCLVTGGSLLYVVYPPLKEAALALLQAVPEQIDVRRLSGRLAELEGVLAVHELHVWRLAGSRVVASAHIRCRDPASYMDIARRVKDFFHHEGVHATTVQPEFAPVSSGSGASLCELPCQDQCTHKLCCSVSQKHGVKPQLTNRKAAYQ